MLSGVDYFETLSLPLSEEGGEGHKGKRTECLSDVIILDLYCLFLTYNQ